VGIQGRRLSNFNNSKTSENFTTLANNEMKVTISGWRTLEVLNIELSCQVKAVRPGMVLLRYINFRSVTDAVNQGLIYTLPPKPWE
jgi:hypothetical protein